MVEPERARLHRLVADAVLARDPDEVGSLQVAAEHLQLAGESGRAARLLVSVAEHRLTQAAALAAETAARRALVLATDTRTRQQASDGLARALTLVGRWEEALACDGAMAPEDPARLMRMARNAVRLGRLDQAQALIERAGAAGGDAAVLAVTSALLAVERGDAAAALALGSEALALAKADRRSEVACEALYLIGRAHEIADGAEQAAEAFARCAELAARAEVPSWRLQALMELGQIDFFLGEPPDRLREVFGLAREVGVFTTAVWAGITLVYALQHRGDLPEALRVGEEIVSLCRAHGLDLLPNALLAAAAAHDSVVAGRGDDLIADALAASEDSNVRILAESLRGWSALRAGNREAAIRHLAVAAAAVRAAPASAVPADGPFLWVCALAAAGRMQEARSALREVRGLPAAHRVHINAMLLALAAALVDRVPDVVLPALEPARKGAPYYRAVCLLLAAGALRPSDAAAWAREALDVFVAAGAETDAAHARRLLRELGAPMPRARRVGQELPELLQRRGVTAREGEVLRLIGNGLSNAEIADRLFLSVRTVEGNVSRLLAKLDLPSRAGLIAVAQSLFGERKLGLEPMHQDTMDG